MIAIHLKCIFKGNTVFFGSNLLIIMVAKLILGLFFPSLSEHDYILKYLNMLSISSFDFLIGVPWTWLWMLAIFTRGNKIDKNSKRCFSISVHCTYHQTTTLFSTPVVLCAVLCKPVHQKQRYAYPVPKSENKKSKVQFNSFHKKSCRAYFQRDCNGILILFSLKCFAIWEIIV